MTPDSMDSFRALLANQEAMARDITDVKVAIGRLETKIQTLCSQRGEQHTEHIACQAHIDSQLNSNAEEHEEIWRSVNRLTVWGRAVAIIGSITIAVLAILNILLSIGVRL